MSERSLTVLVVDDEPELRDALSRLLGREGYEVTLAADGRSAIDLALATPFDVILLDVALGAGPAGYEVCRTLREQRIVAPIVMLTALDSEGDAVLALEAGADDYVRKPFGPTELRSRLRAVLRRGSLRAESETTRTLGEVSVDPGRGVVLRSGSEVSLTHAERVVLETLTARPGQVFTREQLLGAIWGDSDHRDPHLVDAHIHRLRVKLEDDASQPRLIQTVRGVGYRAAQG